MNYYLITCTEDGDHRIEKHTAQSLERLINQMLKDVGEEPDFAKDIPKDLDYFSGQFIIEGKVIVPKKVEKVTKYEL